MRWPGRGGEELAKKKGQARVTASREEWESTTTHMGWMGHARASRGGETDNQDLLLCGEKQKQTDKRKSKHGNKAQK